MNVQNGTALPFMATQVILITAPGATSVAVMPRVCPGPRVYSIFVLSRGGSDPAKTAGFARGVAHPGHTPKV